MRPMLIGDPITYKGRRHVVVGFTPMSVRPFQVQLFDPVTDQTVWVGWPPAEGVGRAALRVAPGSETPRASR
jgi:hypothetical protein